MKIDISAPILIVLNVAGLAILFFLQYLMFAFLPSIDPATPVEDQNKESIKYILNKDLTLILEAVVGLGILFFFNRIILNGSIKKSLMIFVIELIILFTTMYFFSIDYINKFPLG